ncbi:MAG: DUF2267 domain-containing protein [Kofleriaceae bacterium]|nr:DUF2267 domain-containing protein [Kofleriaceae bacterium]
MIDERTLIGRVAERVGVADLDQARRAAVHTVAALAAPLARHERERLCDELPGTLGAATRAALADAATWAVDPLSDVGRRAGIPTGLALEYAHVVAALLAEELGAELRALLHRHLAPPWRDLFHPREHVPPPPPPVHHAPATGAGHTLATGRPGSRHDVAEHAADPAHAESIARRANPHAADKLSSGDLHRDPLDAPTPTGRHVSDADG